MILTEVAETAGVSKGGLLYHFPTKEALIKGMLSYAIEVFESAAERHCAEDSEPGAWLRGYIMATFAEPGTETHEESLAWAAIIASAANNPSLLAPFQEALSKWATRIASDGADPVAAQVIRLAVDGLWFQEGMGLRPLTESQRSAFVARLLEWSRTVAVA
ncbi:TetR family transcriptional regulator [Azoarcus sp. KH32C]|uniref:TetR family transcriptional regulator n=1 Tax=Azoarcus sp. KH32C TaxID=748247 RepID=UPI001E5FA66C|nr:TetR family transcriptional regulator [Azoarcus sp. KH32C]